MTRRPPLPLYSAQTMLIDGLLSETFIITLTINVSQISARNLTPGQLYVFRLQQDRNGYHSVNWGNMILNGLPAADPDPRTTTTQCAVALNNQQLIAISAGTWF